MFLVLDSVAAFVLPGMGSPIECSTALLRIGGQPCPTLTEAQPFCTRYAVSTTAT